VVWHGQHGLAERFQAPRLVLPGSTRRRGPDVHPAAERAHHAILGASLREASNNVVPPGDP